MAKKRITELATETTLKDGQYVAIDHATDGTKKLNLGAELTDLKEDLKDAIGFKNLKPALTTNLYVDNVGFVETMENSQIALIDISELTSEEVIHVIISGTHNRCRLLFTETDISEVVSGTTGTYKDKGNTTTEFYVNYE